MLQHHSNHSVRLIRHKEGDVQYVTVQLQVIEGETDAELDLAWEQLLEFSQAAASGVGLGFDLHVEDVVLALDEEVHLVGRVHLAPIAWHDLKLGEQELELVVFRQRPLELREKPFALSKDRMGQLRQVAEQANVHLDSGNPAK